MTEKEICDYYNCYRSNKADRAGALSVLAKLNNTDEAAIKELLKRNGIIKESEETPMGRKVTPEMQEEMLKLSKEGLSYEKIAERLNLETGTVGKAIRSLCPEPAKVGRKLTKLTDEQRTEILRLRSEGLSFNKISEQLGVPESTVRHACVKAAAKIETKKEPAPAETGQAPKTISNTTNIPQTTEPVKSFMEFLPILPDFVRTHFGDDVKIFDLTATDDSERPDKDETTPILKIAEIRFFLKDGKRYSVVVQQEEE